MSTAPIGQPLIPDNAGRWRLRLERRGARRIGRFLRLYRKINSVSTAAQEAHNPQRDVPIGIIGSLIICTILYVAVAAVATGVVNYKELGVPDPMALVMDRTGVSWLAWAVKLGTPAGLTTAILVLLYGQTRMPLRWRMTACCRRSSQGFTRNGARLP